MLEYRQKRAKSWRKMNFRMVSGDFSELSGHWVVAEDPQTPYHCMLRYEIVFLPMCNAAIPCAMKQFLSKQVLPCNIMALAAHAEHLAQVTLPLLQEVVFHQSFEHYMHISRSLIGSSRHVDHSRMIVLVFHTEVWCCRRRGRHLWMLRPQIHHLLAPQFTLLKTEQILPQDGSQIGDRCTLVSAVCHCQDSALQAVNRRNDGTRKVVLRLSHQLLFLGKATVKKRAQLQMFQQELLVLFQLIADTGVRICCFSDELGWMQTAGFARTKLLSINVAGCVVEAAQQ
jgi:hypothetical protein